jgi:hypothetical protein
VARGKGGACGLGDQRPEHRPRAIDGVLDPVSREPRDEVRCCHEQEELQPPHEDRGEQRDDKINDSRAADPRDALEDGIQPADAVLDDPALGVAVEADQTGSSCFVDSINC